MQTQNLYIKSLSAEKNLFTLREITLLNSYVRYHGGKGCSKKVSNNDEYTYSIIKPITERKRLTIDIYNSMLETINKLIAENEVLKSTLEKM